MQDQIGVTVWITALSSIIAAAISALLTHLYRNRRDKAVVNVSLETFKKFRLPISLPPAIHQNVRPEGTFKKWLGSRVKWEVDDAMERNAFEMQELQDLRVMIPRFLERIHERVKEIEGWLKLFEKDITAKSLTGPQCGVLARLRDWWLKTYKQDIFVALSSKPQKTLADIRNNFDGDLVQDRASVTNLRALQEWLDKGLGQTGNLAERITPAPKNPDNPQEPYLCIELLIRNSGRSETLIKNTATLTVGDFTVPLRSITGRYGFELYTGKYWRVKPTSIEQARFSQDPRQTTLDQLRRIRDLIDDRRHRARVTIFDYVGNPVVTDEFDLRDQPDEN